METEKPKTLDYALSMLSVPVVSNNSALKVAAHLCEDEPEIDVRDIFVTDFGTKYFFIKTAGVVNTSLLGYGIYEAINYFS